jgi:hypothetical protein
MVSRGSLHEMALPWGSPCLANLRPGSTALRWRGSFTKSCRRIGVSHGRPETVDSAIAVAPPPPTQIARPQPVSQINVTTTSASHGLCDPPPHATPTWSRSRAHRRRHARLRPPSPPPSSTSLQVDVVTAAGCYRSGDTPGGVEAGPARPMAAPPGRHVTVLADRSVGSAACRRRSTSPPPAASSCSTASPYCRIRA